MHRSVGFRARFNVSFLIVAAALLANGDVAADEVVWDYVAESDDSAFATPMRFLLLESTPPEDAEVEMTLPETARFAQIRYGSFDSRRTIVMVIPSEHGADLWVDSNHDRRISESERMTSSGSEWTIPFDAEFTEGDSIAIDRRQVRIRYAKDRLSLGTPGYVAGLVDLDGRKVAVRRVDGNGNGQFADPADLIWLDLNGDDRWDPFTERFPFTSFFRHNGIAYTCLTDLRGQRFLLSKMLATGSLQLQVTDALRERGLTKIGVVLAGRAGSIIHLDQNRTTAEVPVDDYRPVSLIVMFECDERPGVWTFEFVSQSADHPAEWVRVAATSTATIDPLSGLSFGCSLNRDDATYTPGSSIGIQPTLVTAHGLRIQSGYFGMDSSRSAGEPKAKITVVDHAGGKSIGDRVSGFT